MFCRLFLEPKLWLRIILLLHRFAMHIMNECQMWRSVLKLRLIYDEKNYVKFNEFFSATQNQSRSIVTTTKKTWATFESQWSDNIANAKKASKTRIASFESKMTESIGIVADIRIEGSMKETDRQKWRRQTRTNEESSAHSVLAYSYLSLNWIAIQSANGGMCAKFRDR